MSAAGTTRRAALIGALLAPVAALARDRGGVSVDVSPLRSVGDNTDADYFARVLPGYLAAALPGRSVRARIDDVTYGPPGGAGGNLNGAVDSIQGVGIVDGREIPIFTTHVVITMFPDPDGYFAHQRQDVLARSFAQWLSRPSSF